jgi:para-nitrobenzyl esterase
MKTIALTLFVILVSILSVSAVNVHTHCGPMTGFTTAGNNVNTFLGIPYAQPPVGSLRWQPAQAASCWSGTFQATSFSVMCPQSGAPEGSYAEDCLYLNVWTPPGPISSMANLPVMVFIHGGSLVSGTGAFDGSFFVANAPTPVVLVTINYRLSGLGWMALSQLTAHDQRGVSGNYGSTDQIMALKWVKQNIAAFGGNPNLVTVFGQSSGATSVLMLLGSPLAQGLFHRAILESASTRVDLSLADAQEQNSVFTDLVNCTNAPNVYNCLMALTPDEILNGIPNSVYPYWSHPSDADIPIFELTPGAFLAIVDGVVIPEPVDTALENGLYNDVPVIIGSNQQEIDIIPSAYLGGYTKQQYNQYIETRFQSWGPQFGDRVNRVYPFDKYNSDPQLTYETLASDIHVTCGQNHIADQFVTGMNSPVYRYILSQRPASPVCYPSVDWCSGYVFHTYELAVLFNNYNWFFPSNYTPAAQDYEFGNIVRGYWTYFAKHGYMPPASTTTSAWLPYNTGAFPQSYNSFLLSLSSKNAVNWRSKECSFWNDNGFYAFTWNS